MTGKDRGRTQAAGRRIQLPVRVLAGAVSFLLLGNLAVLGAHLVLRRGAPSPQVAMPISNFTEVDHRVWRGAAPSEHAYAELALHGVSTVVDLRAEDYINVDEPRLAELGIKRVHIPMRDGQAPDAAEVSRFLGAVAASPGRVFVHCGAGVGRTGTMAAAYLVSMGSATPNEAVRRNLAVGPPSLEQIAFAAGLEEARVRRPPAGVVAVSRVLDAPRRIWVNLRAH